MTVFDNGLVFGSIDAVDAELARVVDVVRWLHWAKPTVRVLGELVRLERYRDALLARREEIAWLEVAQLLGDWELSWPGTEAPRWPQDGSGVGAS